MSQLVGEQPTGAKVPFPPVVLIDFGEVILGIILHHHRTTLIPLTLVQLDTVAIHVLYGLLPRALTEGNVIFR